MSSDELAPALDHASEGVKVVKNTRIDMNEKHDSSAVNEHRFTTTTT